MKRTFLAVAILVCFGSLGASPALAWGFKAWAATTYVSPLSSTDQNVGGVTAAVKASNEMGYGVGAEFRTGLLGVAFDLLHARQELNHDSAGLLGTADFNPISATLNLHLPTPAVEIYAGPTVSYVNWGDLDLKGGGTEKLDAKLGYGISAGADFPIVPMVAVTGGLRWLRLEAQPKNGDAIAVDPLISHIGLAVRF